MVEALLEQAAWLTPTSLFLLLNLVIATIVFSSSFSHRRTNQPDTTNNTHLDSTSAAAPPPYNPPQLARAPSLFSRVTSFNLSNYYPHPHHDHDHDDQDHHNPPPSLFSRVASFKLSGRADEPAPAPEPEPESEPKMELKRAVVRSPSFLSRVASFTVGPRGFMQEEVGEVDAHCDDGKKAGEKAKKGKGKKKKVVERVETASFRKNEEEVDAKADDFINRFKQQLKLQRIESLMRYRSA